MVCVDAASPDVEEKWRSAVFRSSLEIEGARSSTPSRSKCCHVPERCTLSVFAFTCMGVNSRELKTGTVLNRKPLSSIYVWAVWVSLLSCWNETALWLGHCILLACLSSQLIIEHKASADPLRSLTLLLLGGTPATLMRASTPTRFICNSGACAAADSRTRTPTHIHTQLCAQVLVHSMYVSFSRLHAQHAAENPSAG